MLTQTAVKCLAIEVAAAKQKYTVPRMVRAGKSTMHRYAAVLLAGKTVMNVVIAQRVHTVSRWALENAHVSGHKKLRCTFMYFSHLMCFSHLVSGRTLLGCTCLRHSSTWVKVAPGTQHHCLCSAVKCGLAAGFRLDWLGRQRRASRCTRCTSCAFLPSKGAS